MGASYRVIVIRADVTAIWCGSEGLLLAGSTPTKRCQKAATRGQTRVAAWYRLDFSLLRNLQRIVYLDTEVANGAFQLGMAK